MTERKFTAEEIAAVRVASPIPRLDVNNFTIEDCRVSSWITPTPAQREAVAEALNNPEWVEELKRLRDFVAVVEMMPEADNMDHPLWVELIVLRSGEFKTPCD